MKIVVLAGGISTERTVSLVSGTGVCQALRRKGHQAILVDMFMGLENPPADLNTLFDAPDGLCPDVKIEVQAPDLDAVRRSRPDQSPSRIGPHVLDICRLADIVFLGLHGQDGEDGRIQATLDLLGVPYTGAGYLGSAIAMDKIAAKEMMDANGIPNPKWQKLTYTEEEIPQLAETLPMPCVVKAPTGGSSLGVYLPKDRAELADALRQLADRLPGRSRRPWRYRVQVSARSKSRQRRDGDRVAAFAGPEGRFYVLLCDGMGTGPEAAAESRETVGLVMQMLQSGLTPGAVLGSINSQLALTQRGGAVTLDLAELHPDTGRV